MKVAVVGLALLWIAGCSTAPPGLQDLPLLPAGSLEVDASYRLEVRPPGESARQWLLVVRDTPTRFGFEALDEFGLMALRWPVDSTSPAADPRRLLAAEVARLVQLSLAPGRRWQDALNSTDWQLVETADGGRELRRTGIVLLRIAAPAAGGGRQLLYCAAGFVSSGQCRGDARPTQVEVEPLPP